MSKIKAAKSISILNQVLGPVMRGPSSSHTAGPLHLGRLARGLLGGRPTRARLTFDREGSFGRVFREQNSDKGFAAGLMGWEILDPRFPRALDLAAEEGLSLELGLGDLGSFGQAADHPNAVLMELASETGRTLELMARSIGGGAVEILLLDGLPVYLTGDAFALLALVHGDSQAQARALIQADGACLELSETPGPEGAVLVQARRSTTLEEPGLAALRGLAGEGRVWAAEPIYFVQKGAPLFDSGAKALALAQERGLSLGQLGLAHEASLLGLEEGAVLAEMDRRLAVMERSVKEGLSLEGPPLGLMEPVAGRIMAAEQAGRLALGGVTARAGARAMAVMHQTARAGVVCATPTGGSSGVLPGTVVSLLLDLEVPRERVLLALLAAGAVGVIMAARSTFAAEVAGCQVEIGIAQGMAAAAVIEATGGGAGPALDAAAIGLQNAMGSVCDPVQGLVEIPCHTRNAAASASAFVLADLILGGYVNPIPLDESIDAADQVGRLMPASLRCTALGGLAVCPSARSLRRLDKGE